MNALTKQGDMLQPSASARLAWRLAVACDVMHKVRNSNMGNTVWILSESNDSDDWDHSLILKLEKSLNKLASEIGVAKISDFYDNSILAEEFGEEVEPLFSDPAEIEPVLNALIVAIKQGQSPKLQREAELMEELEDCVSKVTLAKSNGERVRVAIVP